jgi:hypothetical protein
MTKIRLPSGGVLPIYEPKHPRPRPIGAANASRAAQRRKRRASPSRAKRQSA